MDPKNAPSILSNGDGSAKKSSSVNKDVKISPPDGQDVVKVGEGVQPSPTFSVDYLNEQQVEVISQLVKSSLVGFSDNDLPPLILGSIENSDTFLCTMHQNIKNLGIKLPSQVNHVRIPPPKQKCSPELLERAELRRQQMYKTCLAKKQNSYLVNPLSESIPSSLDIPQILSLLKRTNVTEAIKTTIFALLAHGIPSGIEESVRQGWLDKAIVPKPHLRYKNHVLKFVNEQVLSARARHHHAERDWMRRILTNPCVTVPKDDDSRRTCINLSYKACNGLSDSDFGSFNSASTRLSDVFLSTHSDIRRSMAEMRSQHDELSMKVFKRDGRSMFRQVPRDIWDAEVVTFLSSDGRVVVDYMVCFGDCSGSDSSQLLNELVSAVVRRAFIFLIENPRIVKDLNIKENLPEWSDDIDVRPAVTLIKPWIDDYYGLQQPLFDILSVVLHMFGICEAPDKRFPPTKSLVLLGMQYDLTAWTVEIPEEKRLRYRQFLESILKTKWLSKHKVCQLVGIMVYATTLAGHKSASIQLLLSLMRRNKANSSWKGLPLCQFMQLELRYWYARLKYPIRVPISCENSVKIVCDAAIPTGRWSGGLGFWAEFSDGSRVYSKTPCCIVSIDPKSKQKSIVTSTTSYELLCVCYALYAIELHRHIVGGVTVFTDSLNSTFLKGTELLNAYVVSEIAMFGLNGDVNFSVEHRSKDHSEQILADALSRFHQKKVFREICNLEIATDWIELKLPVESFPYSNLSTFSKRRFCQEIYRDEHAQMERFNAFEVYAETPEL